MLRTRFILALLFLVLGTGHAAETVREVEYGNAGGERLLLDVRTPAGSGPFPVVLVVHGGGWSGGDKADDCLFGPLARAGYLVFSINYRLAPKHPWPAGFDDVRAAIRWVGERAPAHQGDPARIALLGYSAGGQLATLAALRMAETADLRAIIGLAPAVDLVADSRRRGIVSPSLQGLLGLPESLDEKALATIAAISPAEEIRPGLPPFLLVQGTADQSVRHVETVAFARALEKAGAAVELLELPGAGHRISEWQQAAPDYQDKVIAWLDGRMKQP